MAQQTNSSQMTTTHFDEVAGRASSRRARADWSTQGPGDADTNWPAWKVTVVVIVFCAAFWSGIGYIAMRLFG